MAKNEAKIKFTADCKEFNEEIRKSESDMKQLRSELKLNEAQMQTTGTSVEGLRKKHDLLSEQLELSEKKTAALSNKLEAAVRHFGEGSTEVAKLRTQLTNAQTAEEQLRKAVQDCSDALEEQENHTETVNEGFSKLGETMTDLAKGGFVAVTGSIAAAGTVAATTANDIDKAINTFVAKTGESAESAKEFEDVMTSIYNGNYGESFEDISESMATVKTAMGDIGADELESLTTQALILRDTFDMDVNESIRAVNSMMDQFGITADEAYSLVAQGAQSGLNQNGDLLDVINEYSVQFQNAGYSAEDMFNMLSNGVESGTWSVDKLGDAVKEFNIRMSDGSAKDAVEALGFSWEQVSADWSKGGDSAKEVFNMLVNELDGLENTTEGYSIGVGLLGTMYEDLGQDAILALSSTKGEISSTKDALSEINAVKYDDLGSALEGIGRNLQTSIAEPFQNEVMPAVNEFVEDVDWEALGETIGEAFGVIVEGAMALVEATMEAVKWMKEHKGVVTAVATAVGVLTTAVTAYNVVQAVKEAMDAANVTTVWALVEAHIAQAAAAMAAIAPYVAVVAAIAAVIAIIVLCVQHWDEIVLAVQNAWEKIKETLAQWGEWINTNVIQPLIQFFTGLWDTITSACATAWDWVKEVFASFVSWIGTNVITPIVNFFTGLWESLKNIWDTICNVIQVALMMIGSIISAAFEIITAPYRFIWENCKEYVFAAWEWIKNAISTAIEAVKTVITNVMEAIRTVITTIWDAIKTATSTVWDVIKEVMTTVWEAIKTLVTTAIEAVMEKVTAIWNTIKDVTSTVWEAIKTVLSNVWNNIKSVVTAAIDGVKSVVSSVWNEIKTVTANIWDGVKTTISNVWDNIKNTVSNVVNGVKTTLSNTWNSIKSTASSVWNGIKTAIVTPIEKARDTIKGIIDKIVSFFKNMKVELPKIKLPHIRISGKLSLDPPQVPKLSIEWYKEGGIMTRPTIFGMNGGSLMVGGEAGPEAILPIDKLEGYISGAVEKHMNVVNLQSLADAIEEVANRPISLNINGRQFALATAGDGDSVNGLRNVFRSRGLAVD